MSSTSGLTVERGGMTRSACCSAVLLLALVSGCVCGEVTQREFRVVRVIDGDTFRVFYDGEETSVRLAGCDTPEPNEPGGREATNYVRDLIDGNKVRLRFANMQRKRDNFGRLLCWVEFDGDDLTDLLIQRRLTTTFREE